MKPSRLTSSLVAFALLALGGWGARNASAAVQLGLGSVAANLERRASVPLALEAGSGVVAFQVDVVANPAVVKFQTPVTAGLAGSHFAEGAEVERGVYRILVYSLFNQPVPDGPILNLQCTVDPAFGGGSVLLSMTNAIVANAAGTTFGDVRTAAGLIQLGSSTAVRITSAALGAGVLRLQVAGLSSGRVTVEQASVLGAWSEAASAAVSGSEMEFSLPVQPEDRARFFRIRAE